MACDRPQKAIGRSVLNYFGSKVSSAHKYPAPKQDVIIEPFAGGAGYSLCYWERQVVLIDMNPDVVDTWRYVIEADPEEIRALPLIEPGQKVRELGLPRGPELLLRWSVNQTTSSPRNELSSFSEKHLVADWATVWGTARRERIARVAGMIKHWHVICGSYADLPDVEVTWFIDPPYFDAGKNYPFGSKMIDYQHLGAWCRSRRGQTIVCENEGASWLPFVPFIRDKRCATLDNGVTRRRTEVIWTNA